MGTGSTVYKVVYKVVTKETTEQELRKQIAALDRKIASQAKRIAKLKRELAVKRNERAHLIRQRIELSVEDQPNAPRTITGQQEAKHG